MFPTLLAETWKQLPEGVRRLHAPGVLVRAEGTFRVRRGNWLAQVAAWWAGLPRAGEAERVVIEIVPVGARPLPGPPLGGEGELWRRVIGGRELVSQLYATPEGLLVERVGATEMVFRLEVREGVLHYVWQSSAIYPFQISLLPNWNWLNKLNPLHGSGWDKQLSPLEWWGLGAWHVALPRWLSPRATATESAGPSCADVQVAVELLLPLIGRLIAYEGTIRVAD